MLELCKGWSRMPIQLSPHFRYYQETLVGRVSTFDAPPAPPLTLHPVWVKVMRETFVKLESKEQIELACKLVSEMHNYGREHLPYVDEEESLPSTPPSSDEPWELDSDFEMNVFE